MISTEQLRWGNTEPSPEEVATDCEYECVSVCVCVLDIEVHILAVAENEGL
jgi:hypothetical protein